MVGILTFMLVVFYRQLGIHIHMTRTIGLRVSFRHDVIHKIRST